MRAYKQTGPTCGAACVMMALDFFGRPVEFNETVEMRIYGELGPYGDRSVSTPTMGGYLAERGLDVTIWHKNPDEILPSHFPREGDYWRFYKKVKRYLQEEEEARTKGLKVELKEFSVKDLLTEINPNTISILRTKIGEIGHYQVVYGHQDDIVLVACPTSGLITPTVEEMERSSYFRTGRSCLIVRK